MDNVLFVRGFDAVNQLLDDGQRVIEVHGTAQQRCSQILSLDILHDQIVRPNVVQMADIRVVESHNRAGFAGEALCECALDTLIATSRSSRIVGAINLAHPARANGRKDFVRSKTSPSGRAMGVEQF
jgi:hypothetical protein